MSGIMERETFNARRARCIGCAGRGMKAFRVYEGRSYFLLLPVRIDGKTVWNGLDLRK